MGDTYFDWFRTALGRPDAFPRLDDGQRAALDAVTAADAAGPGAAGPVAPGGPPAEGAPTASPSEYLLDTTVALTAFESFAGRESWAAAMGMGLEPDALAPIPDYGGDTCRVENIGSSLYVNEGGAIFDGDTGVSVIPGEGVSY